MKNASQKRNDIINASEINQYIFCSIAWKLQRSGHKPISPLLEVGKKAHIELGNIVDKIHYEVNRSKRFAVIGYVLLIVAICIIMYRVIL